MYLSALPTLLVVVASFGALFCLIAWIALRFTNHNAGAWLVWILYVPAASLACILKLTGIGRGAPAQSGLLIYYFAVAFAGLGLPLLASTLVLTTTKQEASPRAAGMSLLTAWIAAMATTPLAIAIVAIVDALHARG